MRFRSLRARLLVTSALLVVGLTVATVAYVSMLANRTVDGRLREDLERSRKAVAGAETQQFARLQILAESVASFPELRALLATDAATVRDFLSDYRERHGLQGLLIALNSTGQVVARSDTFAPLELPDVERAWLAPLGEGRPVRGFVVTDGRTFHAVAAAAESGGTVFGVILAASPIDDRWAAELRDSAGTDVVIVSPNGIEGSSMPRERLTWQRDADVPATLQDRPLDLTLTGERFQAVAAPLAPGPRQIVILRSRDQALAPYRNLQLGLLALGVAAALLGLAGSIWLARSITAPVGELVAATTRVAGGDFNVRLDVPREDEIGTLARAFNQMTAGLRERADMTRFVSASTVEMIHRKPGPGARTGERKVITLFFSDLRGFTSFSEARLPEQAVTLLNQYLSLQADLVKRFDGDVDKFTGDGLLAHFSGQDMALDAIRCGLEIHKAVAGVPTAEAGLSVGIGIATGDVLVGSVGSEDRLDYTAIGPAVNLAARLCAVAEPGQILLDAETFTRVSGLVAATAMPPLVVKGLSAPVAVYAMSARDTTR
jgi:adenylate cyclase